MAEIKEELVMSGVAQVGEEMPLIILKLVRWYFIFNFGLILTGVLIAYFGVIVPVIKSGDYAAAFFSAKSISISRKIIMFYAGLFAAPLVSLFLILLIFRVGDAYFFEDKLMVIALISKRKITIPYKEMHVLREKATLFITKRKIPGWSHPWQLMKIKYLDGIGFNINSFSVPKIAGIKASPGIWKNIQDGPKAMQLIKERAYSYTEKRN